MDYRVALVLKKAKKGLQGQFHNVDDGVYKDKLEEAVLADGKLKVVTERGRVLTLAWDGKGGLTGTFSRPLDSTEGSFIPKGREVPVHLVRGTAYLDPRQDKAGNAVTAYGYHSPADLGDGWDGRAVTGPAKELLEEGVRKVLDGTIPRVHSLTVVQGGRLVLDEYFRGYDAKTPHPLHSITKSIFSLLFGVAQDRGLLSSEDRLYDLFPQPKGSDWDARKDSLLLSHLLTMTSGFDCDDWKKGCSWDMVPTKGWDKFILPLPLAHDPGSKFTYCGACLGPLSAALAVRAKMDPLEFARRELFEPLGIKEWKWMRGPSGEVPPAFGLEMRPRDLAKVGLLLLRGGEWKGRKMVSPEWIARSTMTRVAKKKVNGKAGYGYLWWNRDLGEGEKAMNILYAWGVGGQYLFIVPEKDLACVITAGNYKSAEKAAKGLKLFQEWVLPAF